LMGPILVPDCGAGVSAGRRVEGGVIRSTHD
jgi:hypothetical protein